MMEAREFQFTAYDGGSRAQLIEAQVIPKCAKRVKRMMRCALLFAAVVLLETIPAILAGILVGIWLVPAAYAERGYIAFGGEWLLIMVAMFAVAYVTHTALWKWLEG